MNVKITLIVNGDERTVVADPARSQLDVMREEFHLPAPNTAVAKDRVMLAKCR